MAKKHKHEEHVKHERWVISFADMMTLLFALFVVLYALGQADLTNCERELIHFAGSIQPHGALLVMRESDLTVLQATRPGVRGLAAAVNELLADPARRAELSAVGLRRAMEFDWSTVARDVERVYESIATPGQPVTADLSEQLLGRWARRTPREV